MSRPMHRFDIHAGCADSQFTALHNTFLESDGGRSVVSFFTIAYKHSTGTHRMLSNTLGNEIDTGGDKSEGKAENL